MNANLNRIIKQALYELKHQYGDNVTVYKLESAVTDYDLGTKTATTSHINVKRAIVMPAQTVRKFFQGITYISESKSFVSQGHGWDQDTRGFIFEGSDLPGYIWEKEDWIVYRGRRYEVKMIEELEFDTGWLIAATRVRGAVPEQVLDLNVVSTFNVSQVVNGQ